MSKRKETPDLLAAILNGEPDLVAPIAAPKPVVKKSPPAKPTAPAVKRQPPAVKDWDYCLVTFQEYKGWRPRYVNGEELQDWMSGPVIHEYLNQVSGQGWELVTAASGEKMYGIADRHQLYFRRTKKA